MFTFIIKWQKNATKKVGSGGKIAVLCQSLSAPSVSIMSYLQQFVVLQNYSIKKQRCHCIGQFSCYFLNKLGLIKFEAITTMNSHAFVLKYFFEIFFYLKLLFPLNFSRQSHTTFEGRLNLIEILTNIIV